MKVTILCTLCLSLYGPIVNAEPVENNERISEIIMMLELAKQFDVRISVMLEYQADDDWEYNYRYKVLSIKKHGVVFYWPGRDAETGTIYYISYHRIVAIFLNTDNKTYGIIKELLQGVKVT